MLDNGLIIGIDIGGTNIRIGAVSKTNEIENLLICTSQVLVKNKPAIQGLTDFIKEYIAQHHYRDIEAVSIGLASTISKNRKVVYNVPNILISDPKDGLDNMNIVYPLNKSLGLPVYINRDVNNQLLCEITMRNLIKEGIVLGFYIGTGYGNSIYINNTFLSGKNGVAGELGHTPFYQCNTRCNCGKRGCVECVASGFALQKLWKNHFSQTDFKHIFNKHRNEQILIDFVEACALPIATEINIFDPDYIIIGGGVVKMNDFPTNTLEKFILQHTRKPYPANNIQILYSQYEQEAGLIGAALHARKEIIDY